MDTQTEAPLNGYLAANAGDTLDPSITIVVLQPGQYRLETDGVDVFAVPTILRMMANRTEAKLLGGD